jgi:hypothetical protein
VAMGVCGGFSTVLGEALAGVADEVIRCGAGMAVKRTLVLTSTRFAVPAELGAVGDRRSPLDTNEWRSMPANDSQKQFGADGGCAVVLVATSKHAGLTHKLSSRARSKPALRISLSARRMSALQKYTNTIRKKPRRKVRPKDICCFHASCAPINHSVSRPDDDIRISHKEKFCINKAGRKDRGFNAVMGA